MDWRDRLTKMTLKLGPILLIVISFSAILIGLILNAISINELQFSAPPTKHFPKNVVIANKLDHLIWFLQITDLHISNRGNHERERDLKEFATKYTEFIKPQVVLVTGDITDGRQKNTTFGSAPQEDEWITYHEAVFQSGALNKTNWLDVRGNHDNFNVLNPLHPDNFYRRYSVQGPSHARNYAFTLNKDGNNYTFIGVDEVQTPGLKIPLNFIGIVKDRDLQELENFKRQATEIDSQYTIWFAHYPTSSVASPNIGGLRSIVDGPYLCGHYHTIGNLIMKMHASQQHGYVEVELGDWKNNRRIRLAAIDNQLYSQVDVKFGELPIALMTNPKNAELSMPKYEPVDRMMNSTHIRVIAFSDAPLTEVQITIDGSTKQLLTHSGGPLYTLPWNPKDYATGLHRANITVTDATGKNLTYAQSFSLDHSKDDFAFGARMLIRGFFITLVMSLFFFIVFLCTLPILMMRFLTYTHDQTSLKRHYKNTFLFRLHLLSKGRLLWPMLLVPAWLSAGPLFVGYLVSDVIGVCFVWGIWIDSNLIREGFTYNICSIFLLLVHIPMLIIMSYQVSSAYKAHLKLGPPPSMINSKLVIYAPVTVLQLFVGHVLRNAYGFVAVFTSFPFTWCIFIYAYCWYSSCRLSRSDFAGICGQEGRGEEQRALTDQRTRDDKSSTSDRSTC